MKRAILILILCAVFLSACGNAAETAERSVSVDTSAVSQTTTAVTVSAVTSGKEEKDTSEAATTTFKTSSQTVSETSKPTDITVTTTKKSDPSGYSGNSSQGQNNSAQNNNGQENNYQPVQNDSQPDNSPSDNNRSNNGAEQNNDPTTTAKPAITNPPVTTTKPQTTTVPQTEPPAPEPIEEERYMDIGRNLSHDDSDYGKAEAVYNWMTENGSGTCVNFSWQTYYLCKGTDLECYLAWTPSKLYGHVANVVKVNGTWFVLDTQGQGFLLNNDCGFSEIIDIDESYVSGADLISSQRYDEIY